MIHTGTIFVLIGLLFSLLCCDTDPNDESCARLCADRYGECERDCKTKYTVGSFEYQKCKSNCEEEYNTCVFDCY